MSYPKELRDKAEKEKLSLITIDTPTVSIQMAVTKVESAAITKWALAMLSERRSKSSPSTS